MPASHPPTLITLAKRALRGECGVTAGDHLLVAVSGGGDSMALLHVLARLRDELGFGLSAHGVDHGLRPAAREELALARALAERLHVAYDETRVTVPPGGNLQARARQARFDALREAARSRGATLIATGHHADDRAETVLIRLLRGAGAHGLAPLPARDGDLVRPLVRARRSDVRAHLARHALVHAEDPSNADPRFLRTRVRREILPLLESLSPRIVEHLCALADDLREQPPVLVDTNGEPILLGRAQVAAMRDALNRRLPAARIRAPEGKVLRVDALKHSIRLEPGASEQALPPGGAKPLDRG